MGVDYLRTMLELRACVDVDDLEKAIAFYTGVFGLKLGRRTGSEWAELLGASSPIDLLARPAGSPASAATSAVRDYRRHWTPVHLDFTVTDLNAVVERASRSASGAAWPTWPTPSAMASACSSSGAGDTTRSSAPEPNPAARCPPGRTCHG
jgi:predicted enzyme related to lactoylglutathione lyase